MRCSLCNNDKGTTQKKNPKSNLRGHNKCRENVLAGRRKTNPWGSKTHPQRVRVWPPGGWKVTRGAGSFSDPVRWATFGPTGPRKPRFSRFSGSVSDPVFWVSFRPRNHILELEGRKMTQKTGLETDRENRGCPTPAGSLSSPPRGPLPTPARGHVPNPPRSCFPLPPVE